MLIVEEIGLLNSEMNSSLEIVCQEAMENDCKTGEKLKISNGDPFQLMSITCSTF